MNTNKTTTQIIELTHHQCTIPWQQQEFPQGLFRGIRTFSTPFQVLW